MSLLEIRILMYNRNISTKQLAYKLGMSYQRLNRKLDGEREFTSSEMNDLASILGKKEIAFIFFGS